MDIDEDNMKTAESWPGEYLHAQAISTEHMCLYDVMLEDSQEGEGRRWWSVLAEQIGQSMSNHPMGLTQPSQVVMKLDLLVDWNPTAPNL